MSNQNETLEALLGQAEELIQQMEKPDVSLETSFQLYQKGVETLKKCNVMLDEVEKKMLVLNQDGELEEF